MTCKVASPRHTTAQLVDSFLARAEPEDFENRWYAVRAFRIIHLGANSVGKAFVQYDGMLP